MRSSDGEGRSIRRDALYPALSGEWEVPVTRNAKITPVNEGGGGRGKRPGAKRPKCSRAATQIQASLMSHVGTPRRFAAVRRFGRDRSKADMPRASGAV